MALSDYPKMGQSLYDYAGTTAFNLFEQKLDAIIENSTKEKDKRTTDQKIKDSILDFRPKRKTYY